MGVLAAILIALGVCLVIALIAVTAYTRHLSRKYRRAVALRGDRSRPLSGLRLKPDSMAPAGRLFKDGPQTPIECFTDALGLNIMVYSWPPTKRAYAKKPKAVILYCHGLDCCSEVDLAKRGRILEGFGYEGSWFQTLNDAGYLIYGFDYNGMGHSESVIDGERSAMFDYGDYVDNARQLRQLLGERHPSLPFVMLGGSMGACVGLNAVEADPERFDLCVFWCPAVSFEKLKKKGLNPIILPLLGLISRLAPWLMSPPAVTSCAAWRGMKKG